MEIYLYIAGAFFILIFLTLAWVAFHRDGMIEGFLFMISYDLLISAACAIAWPYLLWEIYKYKEGE